MMAQWVAKLLHGFVSRKKKTTGDVAMSIKHHFWL